jgi:ADP-ribose pyrophosphatase YjhB (NUDIX family)
MIEIFADNINKEDVKGIKPHIGARAILKKDNQYLLVHAKKLNLFTLPGGGVEEGESLEEAVLREVREETGYFAKILKKGETVVEYFLDSVWINHYFVLEAKEQVEANLTKEEVDLDLTPVWMTLEEVLDVLGEDQSTHEHGQAISNREFLGFTQSL